MIDRRLVMLGLALSGALLAPLPAAAQPSPKQVLTAADADGDGMVTRQEFQISRSALFGRLDRNGDGAIDGADAPPFGQAAKRMARVIARMDTNGDGRVHRSEFDAAPAVLFDRADLDRNGVVDPYELAQL